MTSADQLARTVLLFQTDLELRDPFVVLQALTAPVVVLVAGQGIVSTRAGQVAITTSAMLMARSGHSVFIDAPDAQLIGKQPPLKGSTLHDALCGIGDKLIDGVQITVGCPLFVPDIAFVFGGGVVGIGVRAKRTVSVGWTDWAGELMDWPRQLACTSDEWPMGAMAAATLVAAEAAKVAGRSLTAISAHAAHYRDLFAPSANARLVLAPELTPKTSQIGNVDIISAGAVSNGFLYALLRIPGVRGSARAYDRDRSDASNRNRNMLLLPDFDGQLKVDLFQHFGLGLEITPVARHFDKTDLPSLADQVVVGVDDIPTRWLLAGACAQWMGVGATSHFNSMASIHYPYSACVACLHPHDEPQAGATPTIAFVSFLAGLLMAADMLRNVAGADASLASRYRYLTPLQMDGDWSGVVAPASACPARCSASRLRA